MENQAKIAGTMDPKAAPDFWRQDAKWQHAILESGTYYLRDPNIETLPTYFQALSDWHYPGQFPIIVPANDEVHSTVLMNALYMATVLGTGFAIEFGFIYLVNKVMGSLLKGESLCCPDDDVNDEIEWNTLAEKRQLSEKIYKDKEKELSRLEKTPFDFEVNPAGPSVRKRAPSTRSSQVSNKNSDSLTTTTSRTVQTKPLPQPPPLTTLEYQVPDSARKEFLESIKADDEPPVKSE